MNTDRQHPTCRQHQAHHCNCRRVRCALALWLVMNASAVFADVVPEAGSASVTISNTVPVVEIVAPTPGGVSHNSFQTFDVDAAGVVINNSLQGGTSAATAAGAIPANSNFSGASASIILNEVTSTARSNLLGVTEILGDDASYILANPNGITCDGCGFIRTPTTAGDAGNLSEVILSTADTLSVGNALDSLTISINSVADIVIGPGGLDAETVDIVTLFTRRLTVDGPLNAGTGQLQALLGTGALNFDAAQPQKRTLNATQSNDNAVSVAIDASLAGAMNAGQIYIMATENGVGVSVDSSLAASAGDVMLTADGDIVYRNIDADGSIDVSSANGNITVQGNTSAAVDIDINTVNAVDVNAGQSATITAGNSVNINCSAADCALNSQGQLTVDAAQLNSDASIATASGNNLVLNTAINTASAIQSGNILAINAGAGNVQAGDLSADLLIDIRAADVSAGNVATVEGLGINSTGSVSTGDITADIVTIFSTADALLGNIDGMTTIVDAATLRAGNINAAFLIDIATGGDAVVLDLDSQSDITLATGALLAGNINASNSLVVDSSGEVTTASLSAGSADITADAFSSAAVNIAGDLNLTARNGDINTDAISAAGNIQISTQSAGASLATSGINSAAGDVIWNLAGQSALAGDISAGNTLSLLCVTADCTVNTLDGQSFNADNLVAQAGIQGNGDLVINANLNASSMIASSGNVSVTAGDGDIISAAAINAGQTLRLTSAQNADINIQGGVTTGGDFIVNGAGNYIHSNNTAQNIGGDWVIDTYSLTNEDRIIAGDLRNNVFRVNRLVNNGLLQSDNALTVQVDDVLENNGVISSLEGVVSIGGSLPGAVTGEVRNNGIISALNLTQQQQPENTLIINPQSLVDDFAAAIARGEQRTASQLLQAIDDANQQALSQLSAGGDLQGAVTIDAAALNNAADGVISASNLVLNVTTADNSGQLLAAQNLAVTGDALNNRNSGDAFGVITARDNIDIVLTGQFDNTGIVEAADVVIDAPVQNNAVSELVLSPRDGDTIDTTAILESIAAQAWFISGSNTPVYTVYNQAGDNSNPLLQSNLTQLGDRFLQAIGLDAGGLPQALPLAGDDVFLSQLISNGIRQSGELPFVTDDRSALLQLAALYDNTVDYMTETGLAFGQMPDAQQREQLTAPVVIFQQQSLLNGDAVYAPVVLLPGATRADNQQLAEQISSRILAYNDLLLRADSITNSGQLLSNNRLSIETIDLNLTTTERNWYVDANGEVRYLSATISAPSLAVNVTGDYVQQGGQLLSTAPILLEAKNIQVDKAIINTADASEQTAQAILDADELYLMVQERAQFGKGSVIEADGGAMLFAGDVLSFAGRASAASVLSLEADTIQIGESDRDSDRSELHAGQSLLVRANNSIYLDYAILQGGAPATDEASGAITGDVSLIAEAGDIINTASRVIATNSGFMQAGGHIINRSVQTVVDNGEITRRFTNTDTQRIEDDDPDAGWNDYTDVQTTTTTTVVSSSQRVETDLAEVTAGAGGLTQIAGGDISNTGNIRSDGDIYQQAEGSINNDIIMTGYTRSRSRTTNRVEQTQATSWGRATDTSVQTTTNEYASDAIAVQTGNIEAGNNLVQIAGGGIGNMAGVMRAGGEVYQQAEGNISNLSLQNQDGLLTGVVEAGTQMQIEAGGDYSNTGNLQSGNSISIDAANIRNERLTRELGDTLTSQTVSDNAWNTVRDITTTTGRQQALDTGRITAGDNIILNASGKITDIAGRYRAGGNEALYDSEGNMLLDSQGNAERGGIYANAKQGIEFKDISWREKDITTRHTTRKLYDDDSEDYTSVTTQTQTGDASRDYTVTGNLQSAGNLSLSSEQGDVILSATGLQSERNIMLSGRNVQLNARKLTDASNSRIGRTVDNSKTISNRVVTLDAGDNILIDATGDKASGQGRLTTQGARFNAAGDDNGDGNVILNATGDIDLGGVNDQTYTYYEHTRKRRFGRRKTTIRETDNTTLRETEINAGGHLLVNVEMDEQGELVGKNSGHVKLEGAKVNTGGNAIIYGEDGVNILSGIEYTYTRNQTRKRGFAGLTRSGSTSVIDQARLGHAEFNTGGDTTLLSKGDINVVAGKIDARNITADATFGMSEAERADAQSEGRASVNIIGDREMQAVINKQYKQGFSFSIEDNFLSVAEETRKRDWNISSTFVGSALSARENITLRSASDINIIGSQLVAVEDIRGDAGRDITILGGASSNKAGQEQQTRRIGVSVSPTENGFEAFAGAETRKQGDNLEQTTSQGMLAGDDPSGDNASRQIDGSGLLAGNIDLRSGGHTTILGSDLATWSQEALTDGLAGDIRIDAGGKLITGAAVNTTTLEDYEQRLRVGIKVSAQENVSGARDAFHTAREEGGAANTLRAIDAIQGAKDQAIGASAGIVAEVESSESRSETNNARITTLNASGNLELISGDDQIHTGTLANAGQQLHLDSGGKLVLQAATDTQSGASKTNSAGATIGLGEGSPVSVNAAYSDSDNSSATRRNARFTAAGELRIRSQGDTVLEGAVAKGDSVSADIGGDLIITSLQDTSRLDADNTGFSMSRSDSGNGSLGVSKGRTRANRAWVSEQSALIGASAADISVQGATRLNGGILQSEADNLQLDTASLSYRDIQDVDTYHSTQTNLGLNTSQSAAATGRQGEPDDNTRQVDVNSVDYRNTRIEREQITRATLGAGDITVRNDAVTGEDSLAGLNRDITRAQEITRDRRSDTDIYYSDSSVDAVSNTVDDGQNNIDLFDVLNPIDYIAEVGSSAVTGLDDIDNALYDAAILNGLSAPYDKRDSKGLISTSAAQTLGNIIEAGVKAPTAGFYQYTREDGTSGRIGDVTTVSQRFEAIRDGIDLNQLLRQDSGLVDRANNLTDESVEGVQNVTQALTDQVGNSDVTALIYNSDTANPQAANASGFRSETIIGINTDTTDIGNAREYISVVAHENSDFAQHQSGNTGEALATLTGLETGYQWVNRNRQEGRSTGGQSGVSVEDWREMSNGVQMVNNNLSVAFIEPEEMEFALYAFDGTGLDKDASSSDYDSNIAKMFDLYVGNKFYQPGPGVMSVLGNVSGFGGDERIRTMYVDLVNTYNGVDRDGNPLPEGPDRDIDIIGFSRGAALAREFANFINEQGIPDINSAREIIISGERKITVYDDYLVQPGSISIINNQTEREESNVSLTSMLPESQEVVYPAETSNLVIRSLGLFDTVGSFGIPGDNDEWNKRMSIAPNVETVRHAVSADENRVFFPLTSVIDPFNPDDPRIVEKAFEGYHTDIGGGTYPDNYLANDSLNWMVNELRASGAPFRMPSGDDLPLPAESPLRVRHNELLHGDNSLIWQIGNISAYGLNAFQAPRSIYNYSNIILPESTVNE